LNIMLVDDTKMIRTMMRKMLAVLNQSNVTDANDGAECVRFITEKASNGEKIDLIFMDKQMPIMDGIEATALIRSSIPVNLQPFIVFLTADSMVNNCIDCGADLYFTKPLKLEKLKEIISNIFAV